VSGPRTFTIAGAKDGAAEQKYDIKLEGETRSWRPPLTMIRVLLKAWGDESDNWVGRRVTLFQDPTVKFGREVLGGIRISHLSHIDGTLNVKVTTTRGKRETVTVQPLEEAPRRDWLAEAALASGDLENVKAVYMAAQQAGEGPDMLNKIKSHAKPAEQ